MAADAPASAKPSQPKSSNFSESCEDWSTRPCGVELGSHDGVVDCAMGVQLCENGRYGACIPDAARGVVTVAAPAPVLPPVSRKGVMTVGGSATSCADDVCNPFCQRFDDEPSTPHEAPRVDTPTGNLSGGTLESSNLPPSFKNKGSLDAQCSASPGSTTWNEACQFDQHCVNGACAAWQPGEFGDCEGVDITTPTTCVPSIGTNRAMTVCNRGTSTAAAGVKCYGYSGGSPQFPNEDPGTTSRLIMTTATALEPGKCETQLIDEDVFHQNGIQSVACNPPEPETVTATLAGHPTVNATTSGLLGWASPQNGHAADDSFTTASPANPSGASSGPFSPTGHTSFQTDGGWLNGTNAYSSTPAGNHASATPALPASNSGVLGPRYPGGFDNPGLPGDTAFNNPDRIYSADASYLSATPSNPSAVTTLTVSPSSNNASSTWQSHANVYSSNNAHATSKLTAAGTSDLIVSGFGLSLPAAAVLDSLELRVKWKTDVNSTKYTLTAQALSGAANTAIGGVLTKSAAYTTETTDSLTIDAATLLAFAPADFSNSNFKVRLRFQRSNGNVTDSTASVDHVQVVLKYHLSSTTASVVYRYFGLGSIPSNASVQMTAEVKWKTSAVNTNVVLGMQLYKNWGSISQAAIGAEVLRVPSAANTDYVDTTATLTPSPADLIDTSFALRLRVTRQSGANNPDVAASIDYVRVTVGYTTSNASTTHSLYLTRFGLQDAIPPDATITSVATTASWRLSATNPHATLGLQAYKASGGSAVGTEVTDVTGPTTFTSATQTVTSGLSRADLSDGSFGVRVRVSRGPSPLGNPDFTAFLDYVSVTVTWTAPSVGHGVTYGDFGFHALPSTATVTQIKTEVRWKNSVSSNRATLGFQLWSGATSLGSEYTEVNPPTTAATRTQTLAGLSLSPSQLADGNFVVKLRATRASGNSNPDFTAAVDFVRVTVTYTQQVDGSLEECNRSNNWTASKLSPSPDACVDMSTPEYVPFTVTRVFHGLCPNGQGTLWRRFGYTTTTPDGTAVEFRFRAFQPGSNGSCTALPAITSGAPLPLATASTTQDPPVCSISGSSCQLDLGAYLGGQPQSTQECLQMDAYGIPAGELSPQLVDWTVLYDCLDNE